MYLVQTSQVYDFILLSPSDSFQLQADYIYPETIDAQIARIKLEYKEKPLEILPKKEFGIKEKDVEYYIPTTPKNLISLFGSTKTQLLAYKVSPQYYLNSRALVYFGGADRLQTESLDTVKEFFEQRVKKLDLIYYEKGDHHFHGYEERVAQELADWVKNGLS